MRELTFTERYFEVRQKFFEWPREQTVVKKLLLAMGMAVLTGLLAQVRFYLPWTPVPVTGQTFAVLMSGVLLGQWWGGVSQIIYVALGIAGIPWFSGWSGGIQHLAGPTGGYLFGFIFAALFIGYFCDKYPKSRNFVPMLGLMVIANFVIVYGLGLCQLALWLNLVKNSPITIKELVWMGAIPFIVGDITKIILVAGIVKVVTPKK